MYSLLEEEAKWWIIGIVHGFGKVRLVDPNWSNGEDRERRDSLVGFIERSFRRRLILEHLDMLFSGFILIFILFRFFPLHRDMKRSKFSPRNNFKQPSDSTRKTMIQILICISLKNKLKFSAFTLVLSETMLTAWKIRRNAFDRSIYLVLIRENNCASFSIVKYSTP